MFFVTSTFNFIIFVAASTFNFKIFVAASTFNFTERIRTPSKKKYHAMLCAYARQFRKEDGEDLGNERSYLETPAAKLNLFPGAILYFSTVHIVA